MTVRFEDLEEQLRAALLNNREQVKALAGLESALVYAQSILDTIRHPVLVLDQELRVRTASRAFFAAFHVSPDETLDRFIYELGGGPWNIPELRVLLTDILLTATKVTDYVMRGKFPDLGDRIMLLNATKLWREGNGTERILLAIEDITDRKRVEDALLRSNEDLQRFAYVAAHDLRTPLNGALKMMQLFQRKVDGALRADDLNLLTVAMENMKRLSALMDDVLAFSTVGNAPRPK